SFGYDVACLLEHQSLGGPAVVMILDEQHRLPGTRGHAVGAVSVGSVETWIVGFVASSRGKRSVNTDPSPSLLFADNSPPIPAGTPRLIVRPSPDPPNASTAGPPTCTYGSKMSASLSLAMPWPVSLTSNHTESSSVRQLSVTEPRGLVNLIAFAARFTRIC